MSRLRNKNESFDAVDARLVRTLAADARTPVAELARMVGMSPPSVSERLRRLEGVGLIAGYHARIDPAALGYGLAAYIRVRPTAGRLATVTELLRECGEIVACDRITGEDCFIAKAHVRSMAELERLIDRLMPYAQTNTSIVQSTPVPPRLPPLPYPDTPMK